MTGAQITFDQETIDDYFQHWRITELALFGSVLREDFTANSDVDVLVTFAPATRWTLFDFIQMQIELSRLLGRQVDLVEAEAVKRSNNLQRRNAILESAQVIYVM